MPSGKGNGSSGSSWTRGSAPRPKPGSWHASRTDVSSSRHRKAPRRRKPALEAKGAEIVRVAGGPAALDLRAVLGELGKREIASLLVEGGSRVLTSFIEAGLADKLVLALSPKLVGGRDAVSFFEGPGVRINGGRAQARPTSGCFPVGRRPDDRGVFLMFTGIIASMGVFQGYRQGRREILIEAPDAAPKLETGASLAVDGVCLSLVRTGRERACLRPVQGDARTDDPRASQAGRPAQPRASLDPLLPALRPPRFRPRRRRGEGRPARREAAGQTDDGLVPAGARGRISSPKDPWPSTG